jgi:AcrR family transcriptional regulator
MNDAPRDTRKGATAHRAPPHASMVDPIRARLIDGLSGAIAQKGYAATTIADIVRHARVSKRTFYEHFSDKEECFLASYKTVSEATLLAIASTVDAERPWREQIQTAARAYFRLLEENAALTRTFMLEIHAAGPRALKLRRESHERFAEQLRNLVAVARKKSLDLRALSAPMATAIVGGINELVLVALEKGRGGNLRELADVAVQLVQAVLTPART